MDGDRAPQTRRADAVRNRERVLAAAEEVFADAGPSAGMQEIARRAGVGVGTVARSFGSKEALTDAVLTAIALPLLDTARGALGDPDPASGLARFLTHLAQVQARHRILGEQLAGAEIRLPAQAGDERRELLDAIDRLVGRAQEAGAVRPDLSAADIVTLVAGVAHATARPAHQQPHLLDRYLTTVLDGLRPAHASDLPGSPLTFEDLHGP